MLCFMHLIVNMRNLKFLQHLERINDSLPSETSNNVNEGRKLYKRLNQVVILDVRCTMSNGNQYAVMLKNFCNVKCARRENMCV